MGFCINRNSDIVVCNEETVEGIKLFAKSLTMFLGENSKLMESYILDYFVEKLWTLLPNSWLETVMQFEPHDLEVFLSSEIHIRSRNPWPLSLLAFRACALSLSISRKPLTSLNDIKKFILKNHSVDSLTENSNWGELDSAYDGKSGQHKNIPEFCRRHVKPKKQHEIFRLGQLTAAVLEAFGVRHAIDIGSGQGHLSRYLALCYNINVVTVESEESFVSSASSFDKKALMSMKSSRSDLKSLYSLKQIITDDEILPNHLEGSVTAETSKVLLDKIFKKLDKDQIEGFKEAFALIGLHTCGDLAPTILKLFTECEESKVVLSVGCCYMKLTSDHTKCNEGYPLSSFVKSLPNHHLSYEAREMACHAIEMFIQRLRENAASLKIHCYRATLEKCIVKYYPNKRHMGLRGVKNAESLPFSVYAEKALSKVSCVLPEEIYSSSDILNCLDNWKEVLTFYSLRLLIAPVVESLILLDRMLFLYEQGYPCCLVPIFDPQISPRNHVLVSASRKIPGVRHVHHIYFLITEIDCFCLVRRIHAEFPTIHEKYDKHTSMRAKVCLVGPQGVGKTSFAIKIDSSTVSSQLGAGTAFGSCDIFVGERSVHLLIADISGEEKLMCMGPIYYKGAGAALCIFDLTSERTLNALKPWINSVKNNTNEECIIIIIGNKSDMENRQVSQVHGRKFAETIGAKYFEVSALTGKGILNVMVYLAKRLMFWNDCNNTYAAKRSIASSFIEHKAFKEKKEFKRRFSFPMRKTSLLNIGLNFKSEVKEIIF